MAEPQGTRAMLAGIRIVDMTSVLFGPYATQTLADMGADVIKIESGQGDFTRLPGRPAHTPGMTGLYMTVNRGKRGMLLDLKQEADAAALRALLATADVFVHNVRAAGMERLGFDYASVRAIRPDIVYVHCAGYAEGGPYAGLKSFDDTIQAASGITSLPGLADGDPRPRYVGTAIADKVGGLHAVYAILAAIVHRLRTGEGQAIQVSMFEAFTHFLLQEHLGDAAFDPPTGPIGYHRQLEPNRAPYPTSDGHVSIVPYRDAEWVLLVQLLGRGDVLQDERLDSREKRSANIDLLFQEVGRVTATRTSDDILALCNRAGIAAMRVTPFDRILDNDHLRAIGFFERVEHPTEGMVVRMAPPVRFGAGTEPNPRPAPHLGEHTAAILAELGLGPADAL